MVEGNAEVPKAPEARRSVSIKEGLNLIEGKFASHQLEVVQGREGSKEIAPEDIPTVEQAIGALREVDSWEEREDGTIQEAGAEDDRSWHGSYSEMLGEPVYLNLRRDPGQEEGINVVIFVQKLESGSDDSWLLVHSDQGIVQYRPE